MSTFATSLAGFLVAQNLATGDRDAAAVPRRVIQAVLDDTVAER